MKQFRNHRDVDAVQELILVGTPVVDEVVDDFRAEFESGLVEGGLDGFNHAAI